ncbi:MAG TPA: AMP-binding protein, partial [Thermoleophilaceae bacterium]|nr:AMP-binding protein [Thermoleophilaceae bacterium]
MSDNLAEILTNTAGRHGDRTAFKLDDFELSYTGLDSAASRIANLLEDNGLKPGDRVGLMLPNVPYFPS